MYQKPFKGTFITLEGGDGCGKSALAASLETEFEKQGQRVLRTREPGGTPLSEHLRDLLLRPNAFTISPRTELLLFLAARVQHLDTLILPALHEGKIVLCERFNDSTIAYQACARNLGMQHVAALCELACEGIVPDVTLLLDVPPQIALARVRGVKDRLEQEKLHFHEEVRQGYLRLAEQYPHRITVIDGTATQKEVLAHALHILSSHV